MARFVKNVGWASAAQMAASLAAFLYTLLTARILGIENFGLFQAAMGIYGLFSIVHLFFYFGSVHCTGKASPEQRPAVTGALLALALFFSAMILTFFFVFQQTGTSLLKSSDPFVWLVCGGLIAANSLLTLFYGSLQAEQRFRYFAASKTIEVSLTLLLGFIFLNARAGAAGAVGGYAASMLLLSVYFWIRFRPPVRLAHAREMLAGEFQSLKQMTAVLFFLLILEHLPAVWARYALPGSESGRFAAVYNLRNTVWPFALSVTLTFYSHLLAKDPAPRLFRQSFAFILILAAGFELAAIAAAKPLIHLLYGPDFLSSASLLPLYGVSLAAQMLAMLFLFDQIGRGKLKTLPVAVSLLVFGIGLGIGGKTAAGILAAQMSAAAACLAVIFVQRIAGSNIAKAV